MKITQGRVSNSLSAFRQAYMRKFGLLECYNKHEPAVFFGMYDDEDYRAYSNWDAFKVVVWCGSDSMMLNPSRAAILKRGKARHIAKSEFISADLNRFGIEHEILPVSWQGFDICAEPLGDSIFHYGKGDFYGSKYLDAIEQRTGLKIYRTTKDTYSHDKLIKVYRDCFIGLRLTKHDGLPNTVIEMGMMGRRSLYNGGIPTAIKYKTLDDIISGIMYVYNNKIQNDYFEVSWKIKNFIDIGTKWLEA